MGSKKTKGERGERGGEIAESGEREGKAQQDFYRPFSSRHPPPPPPPPSFPLESPSSSSSSSSSSSDSDSRKSLLRRRRRRAKKKPEKRNWRERIAKQLVIAVSLIPSLGSFLMTRREGSSLTPLYFFFFCSGELLLSLSPLSQGCPQERDRGWRERVGRSTNMCGWVGGWVEQKWRKS